MMSQLAASGHHVLRIRDDVSLAGWMEDAVIRLTDYNAMLLRYDSGRVTIPSYYPDSGFTASHGLQKVYKNSMTEETIFSRIIRREIPSEIVYQDELVTAFVDINPQAPVHILVIPNKLIATVNDVTTEDELALGRMFTVAAKIAVDYGIADDGYRLLVNCNRHGGQEVYHLHMHVLGGRSLGPMLSRQ